MIAHAYWSTEVNTIPVTASEGRRILEHHRAILQAVEDRDVDLAQSLIDDHFQEGEERLELAPGNASDVQE